MGRESELDELDEYLNGTLNGQGGTVFISGEAGSGKTRLALEFLKLAKDRDVTVLHGWCLSNATVSYFPFIEAFDSVSITEENGSEQSALDSSLLSNPQKMERTSRIPTSLVWKDQTFAAIAKELLFNSTSKPLVLFIDDLHWADSASLCLLQYLSRIAKSERLLIIGTYRNEELSAGKETNEQLSEILRLMGREELFHEIRLKNLNQDEVQRIANDMLGSPIDNALEEKLFSETRGNPLFIVESLRMLREQNGIIKRNDEWTLKAPSSELPYKVKQVILRRIDSLNINQRQILEIAALIGESFEPELVAAAINQNKIEVIRLLDEIEKKTLFIQNEKKRYRFTHPKYAEMLLSTLPYPLKIEYHAQIAKTIEASTSFEGFGLGVLAYHYAQAENKAEAIRYSLAAGREA
ncbi:MAG TPA: AAA family ATPase, partial [Candidatus Nanoarchaeia archaeon]|nr:AAA family ATPase [Candidatus Nanoarchaeia archaeon]